MRENLVGAMTAIADAAPHDANDWWIIGSAAMALSGIEIEPNDVDVLGSAVTMMRFLEHWQVEPGPRRPDARFRSYPYASVTLPDCLPVETMGDLEVRSGTDWIPVRPRTRLAVTLGRRTVFVPSIKDQLEILRLFGRAKDIAKAELIEAPG